MAALGIEEIGPGLVVHLDTTCLRRRGNARTNAERTDHEDRAVEGPHSFVVVSVDDEERVAVLCPLFSRWAPGSVRLDESLKSGYRAGWLGVDLHVSKWQHWEIPFGDLVACSGVERTEVGQRRHYAVDDPSVLREMLAWRDENRAPWRSVG